MNPPDRLDLARLRIITAEAAREPWLVVGIPVSLLMAGAVAASALQRGQPLATAPPQAGAAVGCVIGLAVGAGLARTVREALLGPLGAWFANPAHTRAWLLTRGGLAVTAPVILAALMAPPATAAAFAGALLVGSAATVLVLRRERPVTSFGAGGLGRASLWLAITAVAALAARRGLEQGSEGLSQAAAFAGPLAAGLVWARLDPRLIRILLTTRLSLAGLMMRQAIRPTMAAALAGAVLVAVAWSPAALAGAVGALLALAVLILLRALSQATRSERTAELAFTLEAALLAAIALAIGPFALVWAAFRVAWLWRQAGRRRWAA